MKTVQDNISEVKAALLRCGFHKINDFQTRQGLFSTWHNYGETLVLLWEYTNNNGYELYKPLTNRNSHSDVLKAITYL